MQTVEANISDFTVPVTVIIRDMEISDHQALQFEISDANTVRVAISRQSSKSLQRYKTKKTKTHLLVWRLPDAQPAETQTTI
jgi:hypothetical protein